VRRSGGGIDILDDAVRLLRAAPWSAHLCFHAGSLPFVFGLLFFVVDMRRSALAPEHAGSAALLMALLYLWMKGWHAAAAVRLRRALAGGDAERERGMARRVLAQCAIQPWSLFLLPAALVLTLPFAWVYAYYHAATLTSDAAAAREQSAFRPMENHLLVLILSAGAFVVWTNLLVIVLALPFLLSTFFGIETPFSRTPMLLFDSTVALLVSGLAYLVMGPVALAAYLVRAERAESARTGRDLLRGIDALPPPVTGGRAVACLLAGLLGAACAAASAEAAVPVITEAPATVAKPAGGIPVAELDDALRRATARPEYLWRMPRPAPPPDEDEPGLFGRFGRTIASTLRSWWDGLSRAVQRLARWIDRHFETGEPAEHRVGMPGWPAGASWALLGVIVLLVVSAGVSWWRRRTKSAEVRATVVAPRGIPVDLSSAAPTDAPSDEWLERSRGLLERGELRFAARAVHLATLALLGEARLLTLGRARSDRDYLVELRRRRPDRPEIADLFLDGVRDFERVWYGRHPASVDLVRGLGERCERLRHYAQG